MTLLFWDKVLLNWNVFFVVLYLLLKRRRDNFIPNMEVIYMYVFMIYSDVFLFFILYFYLYRFVFLIDCDLYNLSFNVQWENIKARILFAKPDIYKLPISYKKLKRIVQCDCFIQMYWLNMEKNLFKFNIHDGNGRFNIINLKKNWTCIVYFI